MYRIPFNKGVVLFLRKPRKYLFLRRNMGVNVCLENTPRLSIDPCVKDENIIVDYC